MKPVNALAAAVVTTLAVVGCSETPTQSLDVVASYAPVEKSPVCHAEGNGTFHFIEVADPALPSHIDHGDAQPGQAVPGMDGFVLDAACEMVEDDPQPPDPTE